LDEIGGDDKLFVDTDDADFVDDFDFADDDSGDDLRFESPCWDVVC
jgi:hypothetical protein